MAPRTLFRWRLWLGLITGLGLVPAGFTCAVAVFAMELERLAVPALRMRAVPVDAPAGVDTLVATLRAAHPTARIVALTLAQDDGFAHHARLQLPHPGGKRGPSRRGRPLARKIHTRTKEWV